MEHLNLDNDDQRYRQLIDAITDYAIYMLDPAGLVVSWNPGAQRFKGYAAKEILGQHFSRFYTPEDLADDLPSRALDQAASEGRFENEGWRVRKDGSRFWAHVIIDPIRAESGEIAGYAKVTRDLTERREATEALRRSHEEFQILVNGVTDYAIYMLDPTGRVTNWNSGAERIKGFTRQEIVGRHFSTFYTDEERVAGAPDQALKTAAREGRFETEAWRVRKDGSRFWAHVIIDAIRDDADAVIGFAKVTRDATERKQLELAREALFQSQKLEAIGHLTGGIAHDFNNLLAAVLGSLELARKRLPNDPRITPLLDNAYLGAERGAILTQRMLAFARKQELKVEPVDVGVLVAGMQDFIGRTIGPTIEVRTHFPSGLPQVLTDPYQLEAAVLNIAVNARDAMPAGGLLLISAKPESVGLKGPLPVGHYVRVSVTDTGGGMDEATMAKAADPFFTTKGVGKGTGLGLSMVHGLMVQGGGALELKSRRGEGTTVDLLLPVAKGDPDRTRRQVVSAAAPEALVGLRILVVDDDPLVLANTAALLEDLGCAVEIAASGRQALNILAAQPRPEIVLTDQVMPQMSGAELCEEVRRLDPAIHLVIATGFADGAIPNAPHPRLQKPFTQAELQTALIQIARPGEAARG